MAWMVRSPHDRVAAAAEGSACWPASRRRRRRRGCTCTHALARRHLRRHGRQRADGARRTSPTRPGSAARCVDPRAIGRAVVGSTDMGNVSYLVPVDPPDDQGRRRRRADPHARTSPSGRAATQGDRAVLDGAKAMAMTVVDLWTSATLRDRGRRRRSPAARVRRRRAALSQVTGPRGSPGRTATARRSMCGRDGLRPRGVHGRRGRHPPALLHQPRRPGVRARQPARGGQGGAVRPLQPQPEEPAPAVPRRVRRRPRHQRRPDGRRHRRARARRGAVREGVLRVRRRLGRAARRRAPGLRAGVEHPDQDARVGPADELPRAEHPLHRATTPGSAVGTATTATRRCSPAASAPATSATWTACSTPTACCSTRSPTTCAPPCRATRPTPTSSTARPRGPRRSTRCAACCRRRRCPTSASTAPVRRFEMLLLRMRAHPLPEARHYADLMLHELRKVIPSFLRRVDLAERGGRWANYLATHPRAHRASSSRSMFGDTPVDQADSVRAGRLRPRRRGQAARRDLLPAHATCPSTRSSSGCARMGPAERLALDPGVRGRAGEPPPQAGSGVRAGRLPLRRAVRLRRVPRPAAPPHADHRVAAADARTTATCGPSWSTRRA